MRRHRADRNASELVKQLRKLPGVGVIVWNGDVDLVVGHRGVNLLIEVKSREASPKQKLRSEVQRKLRESWPGQYATVETVDDVLALLQSIARWEHGPPPRPRLHLTEKP